MEVKIKDLQGRMDFERPLNGRFSINRTRVMWLSCDLSFLGAAAESADFSFLKSALYEVVLSRYFLVGCCVYLYFITDNRSKEKDAFEEKMEELESECDQLSSMVTRPFICLLYTSPSPRDRQKSRMPSSA